MTHLSPIISDEETPKRPLSVTLLAWMVLIMALLGWLRLFEVVRQWNFLLNLDPSPPVLYLASTGLIWGLVGVALAWGLILGRSWAPRLMQFAALLYTTYYWLDRLLVADPVTISTRWPFAIGLNIALLILTFWVLTRPKSRIYFNKNQI